MNIFKHHLDHKNNKKLKETQYNLNQAEAEGWSMSRKRGELLVYLQDGLKDMDEMVFLVDNVIIEL